MRRDAGIGITEVLASVALFSLVAAGLAATTIGTVKANNTSKHIAAASTLIYDKIEQFRALDPAANPADFTPGWHGDALNPLTPLGQGGGHFTRTWVVSDSIPKVGIARVVVTVSWNDPAARIISASTYVCRSPTCS